MRETGFLDRTIRIAGVEYPFQVFVPAGLNSTRPHPVILFLHGIGECGDDGLRPTEVGLGTAIRRTGRRFPALVVFPQAPQGRNWTGTTAVLALRALDLAIAEFGGDPRRVYVTGLDRVSGRVRYTEYPGVGHNAWDRAYAEPGLLPWLLAQRREG